MKLFLKKMSLFVLIIILLLVTISFINITLFNRYNGFVFKKNINVLILGDSHSKFAFDDKILTNTINFSNQADSYFYSYLKLIEIKNKNKQIDTLFLSFSDHNIDEITEKRWLFNRAHLKDKIRLYFPMFKKEEFYFLLKNEPTVVFESLFSQVLFPIYFFSKGSQAYGGYSNLGYKFSMEELKNQSEDRLKRKTHFKEALIEIKYLNKIKSYCYINEIKLILVNPPLYKTMNASFYEFYEKNFPDVLFLDYSKLKMPDDSYGDLTHLTPIGANYFSELIKKNKWVFDFEDKQYFKKIY